MKPAYIENFTKKYGCFILYLHNIKQYKPVLCCYCWDYLSFKYTCGKLLWREALISTVTSQQGGPWIDSWLGQGLSVWSSHVPHTVCVGLLVLWLPPTDQRVCEWECDFNCLLNVFKCQSCYEQATYPGCTCPLVYLPLAHCQLGQWARGSCNLN